MRMRQRRGMLAASNEPDPGGILTTLWRFSVDVRPDLQGRITLPEALRTRAGLGSEVLFVGCGDRIEVRAAVETPEQLADIEDHLATLAMLQSAHGLPRAGS